MFRLATQPPFVENLPVPPVDHERREGFHAVAAREQRRADKAAVGSQFDGMEVEGQPDHELRIQASYLFFFDQNLVFLRFRREAAHQEGSGYPFRIVPHLVSSSV